MVFWGALRVLGGGEPQTGLSESRRQSGVLTCLLLYSASRPFPEECWQLGREGALGK